MGPMPDAPSRKSPRKPKPSPAKGAGTGSTRAAVDAAAAGSEAPRRVHQPSGAPVKRALAARSDDAPETTSAASPDEEEESFDPASEAPELSDEGEAGAGQAIVPAGPRSLGTADAESRDLLQRYMAEVQRHPLLSREEELSTSREYIRTGDPKLAYRLVTANLRLVVKLAWEYRRAAFNLLDLIQEGNVGLMQAVRKFDPERGVKLSSYAAWWIRAYIIRYLMDNWRLVKLGTTQAQRKIFFNLRKEKERLAAQGFAPEPKLLAERLQVSEEDVVEMDQRLDGDEFSIDAPTNEEGTTSYAQRLAQGGPALDDALAEGEIAELFRARLADFAKTLQDKERFIFEKRLVSDEPLTLQEVGDTFGVTRERARQLEARLTQKLKDYMRENLPDYAELSLAPGEE